MKVLWISNAPYAHTGYGQQTALFTKLLKQAGHDVVIFPFYGHQGSVMRDPQGIPMLPQSLDAWGNDIIPAHVQQYQPDVTVLLADVWVFRAESVQYVTAWAPVDHDPIPPLVAKPLHHARHVWAMSRFAEQQMRSVGLTPDYVPHGVDTDVYTPMDRAEARQAWGIAPERFVAAMVATNKGYPSRKSLDRVLKAWGVFVQTHPDALLYIHTAEGEQFGGIDLAQCAEFYGVPAANLRFPDLYRLLRGDYHAGRMNALYNAADVLLAPSMGEGFGIPVIEAQAAGCPVVVSDFTAQAELCGAGYKVPVYDDDRFYSLQNSEYAMIRPSEILKGIEWAYEHRGDTALRVQARNFALQYDAKRVLDTYMLPALERQVERQQALEAARQERTAARLAERGSDHKHQWATTGLFIDGKLNLPCNVPDCDVALVNGDALADGVFPSEVNGVRMTFEDDPQGGVVKIVMREIVESYQLDEVPIEPGDVILDVGAQVGVVSTYLAKRHPQARIYAFEPVPGNFERLLRNLDANGVTNVIAVNKAITADGRDLAMNISPETNTGGGSGFSSPTGESITVPSMTLAEVMHAYQIGHVKLLKLDCEGAEYEIIDASADVLPCIDYVRGELHINQRLTAGGHSPEKLVEQLQQHIQPENVRMSTTRMAE